MHENQRHSLEVLTALNPHDGGSYTTTIYCKQLPQVGFVTKNYGSQERPVFFKISKVVESKNPSEFGARALDWDMAPSAPSIPLGKELSYAKTEGVDSITDKESREKHFLNQEQHLERAEFIKGDMRQERKHGWFWASVVLEKV